MSFLQQPLPPIDVLHNGLSQRTTVCYVSDEGRRTVVDPSRLHGNVTYFKRDILLHLPLFLTPPVWKRYGYSLADVRKTLEWNHTDHLYQLGLLFGISPSNSAVKIAFSSPTALVFSSKAIISRKIILQLQQSIMRKLQYHYRFPKRSCLDQIREDHVPALPMIFVDSATYNYWCKQIPEKLSLLHGGHWKEAWSFKDIHMVPFKLEKEAILMTRIIEKTVFEESGRIANSLATKPIPVTVGTSHKQYCGVEEACFVIPNRASERKSHMNLFPHKRK